jgi:hypothetical protein
MDNNTDFNWFISKADKLAPGTANDVDYYTAKVRDAIPPTMGWTTCTEGLKPSPLLIKQFDDASNADLDREAVPMEFKDPRVTRMVGPSRHAMLLRWIRSEQLLEEIVGDRIHKQMLARAGPLLHTLASAGVLAVPELRRMWERAASLHTATDDTTSGLATSILQLVRSTIEFMPPLLLDRLLGMVRKTAFPNPAIPCAPGSGATPGYATAVEFMKMLQGTPALLLVAKGEGPAKAFITLLSDLLSAPRAAGDEELLKDDNNHRNNNSNNNKSKHEGADVDASSNAVDATASQNSEADGATPGASGETVDADATAAAASADIEHAEAIAEAEAVRKEALRQVIMPNLIICGMFQAALQRSQTLGARFRKAYIAMVCRSGLRASMEMDGGGERELDDGCSPSGGSPSVEADPAGVLVQEAFFSRQLSVLQVLLESYPKRTSELGEELHRLSGSAPGGSIAEEGGIVNDLIDEFVAYARRARSRRFDKVGGRGGQVAASRNTSESKLAATGAGASSMDGSSTLLLSKGFQLHLLLISRRLVIIRAVTEKMHGPRLSVAQIDRIYSAISRGGASRNAVSGRPVSLQRETDLFMDWLAKSISTTKMDTRSVLSQSAVRTVFLERLCSTNASIGGLLAHPERMTLAAWKCFHAMFRIVNNLGEDGAPIMTMNAVGGKSHALLQGMEARHRGAAANLAGGDVGGDSKDPEGLHVLWNAVLRADDDGVADAAGEFLLKICTAAMKKKNSLLGSPRGSGRAEGASAAAVSSTEAFLEKVFGRLESERGEEGSTTKTTTRCLRLLSRFVKVSRDAAADAKVMRESSFISGVDDYFADSRATLAQDVSDNSDYAAVPHGMSARGTDMTVHLTGRRQLKPGERASSKQDHHSVTSISGGQYSSQSRAPSMKNLDPKHACWHASENYICAGL